MVRVQLAALLLLALTCTGARFDFCCVVSSRSDRTEPCDERRAPAHFNSAVLSACNYA